MGANILLVMPGSSISSSVSQGAGSEPTLTLKDCDAIARNCPSVRAVAPTVRARTQLVYGNQNWVPSTLCGTTASFLAIREWSVAEGAAFTERDVLSASRVCLLGQTTARELFQGVSPIGKELRVNNVPFTVVGVLASKGANMMGSDQDDILVAPWTAIKYRVAGATLTSANQSSSSGSKSAVNTLSAIYPGDAPQLYPVQSGVQVANNPMLTRFATLDLILASAVSAAQIPSAIRDMTTTLREQHGLRPTQENDFDIRSMTEMTNIMSSTTALMTKLLLCVAMISLMVGGVGIMNIMLVSVTERTHEIGLRMAVGARAGDILKQFLVEAVILCLVGGVLGILCGHGGAQLVCILFQWTVQTSPRAIIAAVLVSATIGMLFGFYPAWKASRLDPIDALRYE